jgi:cell fate (sporulation/competence/biofilm development) regulator YlbF (YheA/YmcA/DUF963 family)
MSCFVEIIAGFKDLAIVGVAVTTAIVAITGLKSWQRELTGKAEFDVARGLVRATYTLRDEVQCCRSPFVAGSEFPESSNGESGKGTLEVKADDWAHVYITRFKQVQATLREFDAQSIEAEALWGPAIREKTSVLKRCVGELYLAIDAFILDKRSGGRHFTEDAQFGREIRIKLNSSNLEDDSNELSKRIRNAVQEIDNAVRPHLRRS